MKTNIAQEYWYDLPEELIAQEPVNPRDSSKLLVYNTETNEVIIDKFSQLVTYLPPSTALTLNDAKVIPARVTLFKESGGKIVVLFLVNEWISTKQGPIPCFLDRKGTVGDKLFFPDKSFCTIQKQEEGLFYVEWDGSADALLHKLDLYGVMPVPPYIKNSPLSRDELLEKYQTVFAKKRGSSAAPTASLHFTPGVFQSLEKAGIKKQYITLHVGLGTFAPLTEENLRTKTLHHEWYETPDTLQLNTDITAVGTTVARTLESIGRYPEGDERRLRGETDLFILPPYEFKIVNHLITNFHLPSSSLMMLVDAFLDYKKAPKRVLELYEFAKTNKFRFYSFGDAMLIL
ncbi:MAG: tRNA preQ1(34) S-adenosylmethionine ribosyltransferase-isomerase QueA [Candidatus Roizmanbacteria bacterium]|nr:tRNA preQ1(34) S-adenosylmethionine ribosyltransferase-isomerase QueA [Candidatus Roizmanbacteria bacterium]